jgi:hypothetical protein
VWKIETCQPPGRGKFCQEVEKWVENRIEKECKGTDHDHDLKSNDEVDGNPSGGKNLFDPVFDSLVFRYSPTHLHYSMKEKVIDT